MKEKNISNKLFAIYKNDIHIGNSYGLDELDALITYFEKANLYYDNEYIKKYNVVDAIEYVHYFKSQYVNVF